MELHRWLHMLHEVCICGAAGSLEESSALIGPALRIVDAEKWNLFIYQCRADLPPVNLVTSRTRMFVTTYHLPRCPAFELLNHAPRE